MDSDAPGGSRLACFVRAKELIAHPGDEFEWQAAGHYGLRCTRGFASSLLRQGTRTDSAPGEMSLSGKPQGITDLDVPGGSRLAYFVRAKELIAHPGDEPEWQAAGHYRHRCTRGLASSLLRQGKRTDSAPGEMSLSGKPQGIASLMMPGGKRLACYLRAQRVATHPGDEFEWQAAGHCKSHSTRGFVPSLLRQGTEVDNAPGG